MDAFNLITALVFTASIALEAYLNVKDNLDHYDKDELRVNIIIALIGVLVNVLVKGVAFSFFVWIAPLAVFNLSQTVPAWATLFLLTDLQYYLFHVLGHKCRFFWTMHVIHHSSVKYNLTTAIRTPFTNAVFRFGSLTPFVLMGYNPVMVILVDSLVVSFTFFQHTEMIKKLGWIEYILSTPSHHRVHHSSNEKYLDKNFGSVLIIWDKLFGTFQEEEEQPQYGLTRNLTDRSITNVLFHEWKDIFRDVRQAGNWNDRIHYLFARPGWKPGKRKVEIVRQWQEWPVMLKSALLILLLTGISVTLSMAQPADELLQRGRQAEQAFKDEAALDLYEKILIEKPGHIEALWRASRMLSNKAGRNPDKKSKALFAIKADEYAKKAVQLDPFCKEARLCRIIALGVLSEAAGSPSEKLANARVIHAEAQAIVKLDSLYAPAYFVLGKWHLELARLNWAEKLVCNMLFSGVPKGVSFDNAIGYFEKAIQLQPDYVLFHYGKAAALYHAGKYDKVIEVLENALQLPRIEPDDEIRQQKCLNLLKKSKQLNAKI